MGNAAITFDPFTSQPSPSPISHRIIHTSGSMKPRNESNPNQLLHVILAKKCDAPAKYEK